MKNRLHYKQTGMAMLTALLMVAIATTIAVGLWYQNELNIKRLNNIRQSYQAQHLTQGLLLWAADLLQQDYQSDPNQYDTSQEQWQTSLDGIIVQDAVLSGDLQGMNHCFNINNLWHNGAVSEVHYNYFVRLLELLDLDIGIADKAVDWLDNDQVVRENGAEDFNYLAKSPPYQTSAGNFMHQSQLALLDGLDSDVYQLLSRFVCVLPSQAEPSKMNINTIPPVMLQALNAQISSALALALYQDGNANFSDLKQFFSYGQVAVLSNTPGFRETVSQLVGVQTRFIQATVKVNTADGLYQSYALLKRVASGKGIVLQRSQIPFLPAIE